MVVDAWKDYTGRYVVVACSVNGFRERLDKLMMKHGL